MENLRDYFDELRKRPEMFLSGTISISKLYDHLQGYKTAYSFNNNKNIIDTNFFDRFTDFVDEHYCTKKCNNWKGVILEQCNNNEELAIKKFFELFDLFDSNIHSS